MKASVKTFYFILAALLASATLLVACMPPPIRLGSVPTAKATAGSTQAAENDPLDNLLTLRSVKLSLTADYPDGSIDSQVVEIDSAGNMHITVSLPLPPADFVPKGVDVSKMSPGYELYVVSGKAYQPDPTDAAWMTKPVDEDYRMALSNVLHGPSGPGLWLDILPGNSITEDGSETVGGFACDRYKVNGTLGDQAITGTIWVDPDAFTLIQAELHVPAVLLSTSDEPANGELKVTLNVEKADVPTVQLPDAPAGPTATPSGPLPTVNPSESGLPDDVPLYPGATDLINLPTGVSFSTGDPPDVVAKFYRDQLPTFNWTLQNEMKPAADQIVQTWMMSSRMLVVMVQVDNGTTTVILMLTGQEPPPAEALPSLTPTSRVVLTKQALSDGMNQVFVPAGEFIMGSNSYNEIMVPPVSLDAFWIDQTEVTNAMFTKFISATHYRTDAEKNGYGYVYQKSSDDVQKTSNATWLHPHGLGSNLNGLEQYPVVQVSWNDATAYCQWAGRRLPTEAEWEKAARGTDGRLYPWGNQPWAGNLANFMDKQLNPTYTIDDGHAGIAPVGSYPDGASPYGALDMVGNVAEWVADWYDYPYLQNDQTTPVVNPQGPATGESRAMRGGAWVSNDDNNAEKRLASHRNWNKPYLSSDEAGFRCASSN